MSDLELGVLRRCVQDIGFLTRAVNQLNGYQYSSPQLNWVWDIARQCCLEHAEAPGFRFLMERAQAQFKDDGELLAVIRVIRQIKAMKLEDASPGASLVEMNRRLKLQQGTTVAQQLVKAIEAEDADALQTAMADGQARVQARATRDGDTGILDVAKKLISPKLAEDTRDFVPTGFSYLDKRWRGFKVGELVLIAGISNVGKSITAMNIGAKAVSRSIFTLDVGTEMDNESRAGRYMSRFTGVLEENIRERHLMKAEHRLLSRWMEANWDRMNKLLRMERLGVNIGTVSDIRAVIRERSNAGCRPTLVLVDSPDHLRSARKYNDKRFESTEVYYDLKGLAEEEHCVVVATTQVHKSWVNKIATKEAVADNYEKVRIADWYISINALQGDKGEERLLMYLGKRRSGKRNVLVPLVAELERMRMDTAPEETHDEL